MEDVSPGRVTNPNVRELRRPIVTIDPDTIFNEFLNIQYFDLFVELNFEKASRDGERILSEFYTALVDESLFATTSAQGAVQRTGFSVTNDSVWRIDMSEPSVRYNLQMS